MPFLLGVHLTLTAPAVSSLGQPSAEPISQGALLFDNRRITCPFTALGRFGFSGEEFLNGGKFLLRGRRARKGENGKGDGEDAHLLRVAGRVRMSRYYIAYSPAVAKRGQLSTVCR